MDQITNRWAAIPEMDTTVAGQIESLRRETPPTVINCQSTYGKPGSSSSLLKTTKRPPLVDVSRKHESQPQ